MRILAAPSDSCTEPCRPSTESPGGHSQPKHRAHHGGQSTDPESLTELSAWEAQSRKGNSKDFPRSFDGLSKTLLSLLSSTLFRSFSKGWGLERKQRSALKENDLWISTIYTTIRISIIAATNTHEAFTVWQTLWLNTLHKSAESLQSQDKVGTINYIFRWGKWGLEMSHHWVKQKVTHSRQAYREDL